jgi:hypothetical protein
MRVAAGFLAAAVSTSVFGGCKTHETKSLPVSSAVVENLADGIHVKAKQGEFLLGANGGLHRSTILYAIWRTPK